MAVVLLLLGLLGYFGVRSEGRSLTDIGAGAGHLARALLLFMALVIALAAAHARRTTGIMLPRRG